MPPTRCAAKLFNISNVTTMQIAALASLTPFWRMSSWFLPPISWWRFAQGSTLHFLAQDHSGCCVATGRKLEQSRSVVDGKLFSTRNYANYSCWQTHTSRRISQFYRCAVMKDSYLLHFLLDLLLFLHHQTLLLLHVDGVFTLRFVFYVFVAGTLKSLLSRAARPSNFSCWDIQTKISQFLWVRIFKMLHTTN